MNYSVTKNGKPLSKSLYTFDEETRTFFSNEDGLVFDFNNIGGATFKTGSSCTFKTGSSCTFETGYYCTFDTGSRCTFKTGSSCTFDTGSYCTFDTESYCTFKTGYYCTFKTGSDCTFNTGSGCTFETGKDCVVVRRDIFEVITLTEGITIKLNEAGASGYTIIEQEHTIVIDGKEIKISEESFKNLKESLGE